MGSSEVYALLRETIVVLDCCYFMCVFILKNSSTLFEGKYCVLGPRCAGAKFLMLPTLNFLFFHEIDVEEKDSVGSPLGMEVEAEYTAIMCSGQQIPHPRAQATWTPPTVGDLTSVALLMS